MNFDWYHNVMVNININNMHSPSSPSSSPHQRLSLPPPKQSSIPRHPTPRRPTRNPRHHGILPRKSHPTIRPPKRTPRRRPRRTMGAFLGQTARRESMRHNAQRPVEGCTTAEFEGMGRPSGMGIQVWGSCANPCRSCHCVTR